MNLKLKNKKYNYFQKKTREKKNILPVFKKTEREIKKAELSPVTGWIPPLILR